MPRFGRTGFGSTGTDVGVGDGVASTAPAGRDNETTSAGITSALEKSLLNEYIRIKINRGLPITWLAHRQKLN